MKLDEVNAQLKRTNIKGRPYIDVAQRVQAFKRLYPDGQIQTDLLSDDGSRCVFKASVIVGGAVMATGHAFEFQSASTVNKTSYIENCETSAVGRALGFMGIGSTESICSTEEVQAAIAHQTRGEEPGDALSRAQKRITAICGRAANLDGMLTVEWYEKNIKSRGDYANDADTLNRIAAELEEAYGNQ